MMRLAILCFLVCASSAAGAADAPTRHVTPKGHVYHHMPLPGASRVGLALQWPAPLRGLTRRDAGVPTVARSLMVLGAAGEREAADVSEDLADLDASVSLALKPAGVALVVAAPSESLAPLSDIVGDVVARPRFDDRWLERERRRAAETAVNLKDRTLFIGQHLVRAATLRDEALLAALHPDPSAFADVTREAVVAWHERTFRAADVAVATSGPVDHALIGPAIDRILRDLPEGEPQAVEAREPTVAGQTVLFPILNPTGSHVTFMGALPEGDVMESEAAQVAVDLLGDGTGSRLFRDVRLRARATYDIRTNGMELVPGRRTFLLEGGLTTRNLETGLEAVRDSYERWRTGAFADAEIDRALRVHSDHVEKPIATVAGRAAVLADRIASHGAGPNLADRVRPDVLSIPRERVRAVARRFPPFDELVRAVLTRDVRIASDFLGEPCLVAAVADAGRCRPR